MRRVLALLVLVAFATGPALRVPCLVACAESDRVAAVSCHADATSAPAVANVHGCPTEGLAVALAVKRADVAAPIASTPVSDVAALHPSTDVAATAAFGINAAELRPPLIRFLIPLRI